MAGPGGALVGPRPPFAIRPCRRAAEYAIALGDVKSVVKYCTKFLECARKCYSAHDSEHLSDKLLQFIYDSYIVSLMMYTDHAMQEVDGYFSRDAVEFMEQVVILGEAADLKEAVLKASTRLSTWFEVGKIPQRHPHSRFVCDIDIDREAARAYRRKTCNILAAKGRDLENSCLICLETLDVDEINEHKVGQI